MSTPSRQRNSAIGAIFSMLPIAVLFVFSDLLVIPRPVPETLAAPVAPVVPVPKSAMPKCSIQPASPQSPEAINELRSLHLQLPVDGARSETLRGSFYQERGCQLHEAADIVAPRNTPVRAMSDGTVAKLFNSQAGGITLYEYDPSRRYVFYYAHLERYADNIKDGDPISKGQVIAYVGDSGDAKAAGPHLHFSLAKLSIPGQWWKGKGNYIDPYEVFKK